MKNLAILFFVLTTSIAAQADVYLCNFFHARSKSHEYSWKKTDFVFKNHKSILKDRTGDVAVSIHYSYSRNIVTQVISDEKIHAIFRDVKTSQILSQSSIDQGQNLTVESPNNWAIDCSSILSLP